MTFRGLKHPWRQKGFKCRGRRQELELKVEPEDVTELLKSHDKTVMEMTLLFILL